MLTRKQIADATEKVLAMFDKQNIAYTPEEKANFEVSDFGLSMLEKIGLELIVYVNNNIYCAKEMGLMPFQICPEHRHPTRGDKSGKMETFRCRAGEVYLYISGDPTENIKGKVPEGKEDTFTVFHEIVLHPVELAVGGDKHAVERPGLIKHQLEVESVFPVDAGDDGLKRLHRGRVYRPVQIFPHGVP